MKGDARIDRERAVRGQPLLGHVCLFGLERFDLHHERNSKSGAQHSALSRVGNTVVIVLYLGLNAAFLRTTPIAEMVGKQQVALIAGAHIFGRRAAR